MAPKKSGTPARRTRTVVEDTRRTIRRANASVPMLVESILVSPKEFAARVRRSVIKGRNPARLLRCLDTVEADLGRRGIQMKAYFESLRRGARRAMERNGDGD